MKRYYFGIIAVIVAVSAVAFKSPRLIKHDFANITFYYTGSTYTSTEVVKKGNWSSTITPPTCVGAQNKACKLVISDTETTLDGSGNRILKNDIQAMAGAGGGPSGFVPSTSTPGFVSKNDKP